MIKHRIGRDIKYRVRILLSELEEWNTPVAMALIVIIGSLLLAAALGLAIVIAG